MGDRKVRPDGRDLNRAAGSIAVAVVEDLAGIDLVDDAVVGVVRKAGRAFPELALATLRGTRRRRCYC